MELQITFWETLFKADTDEAIDCSIPTRNGGVTAWGIPPAEIRPHQEGDFVGSVASGASVNFNTIRFNPHAHGTHTECLGHITQAATSVNDHLPLPLMPAFLVTPEPEGGPGGASIRLGQLRKVLGERVPPALLIRTAPGENRLETDSWSGAGAAYLEEAGAAYLAQAGVMHLLIYLPSVDPESDGGALAAHKAFWGLPENPRHRATITELIAVPGAAEDGLYLLDLQVAAFENDAAPSRPVIYPLYKAGNG